MVAAARAWTANKLRANQTSNESQTLLDLRSERGRIVTKGKMRNGDSVVRPPSGSEEETGMEKRACGRGDLTGL